MRIRKVAAVVGAGVTGAIVASAPLAGGVTGQADVDAPSRSAGHPWRSGALADGSAPVAPGSEGEERIEIRRHESPIQDLLDIGIDPMDPRLMELQVNPDLPEVPESEWTFTDSLPRIDLHERTAHPEPEEIVLEHEGEYYSITSDTPGVRGWDSGAGRATAQREPSGGGFGGGFGGFGASFAAAPAQGGGGGVGCNYAGPLTFFSTGVHVHGATLGPCAPVPALIVNVATYLFKNENHVDSASLIFQPAQASVSSAYDCEDVCEGEYKHMAVMDFLIPPQWAVTPSAECTPLEAPNVGRCIVTQEYEITPPPS